MKSAIYIEDGTFQIVLTAETEFEQSIVDKISAGDHEVKTHYGAFYDCQGGWVRQSALRSVYPYASECRDHSIIITARQPSPAGAAS